MKQLIIGTNVDLNTIDPAKFAIICYIGGDDTLLRDGCDVIDDYEDEHKKKVDLLTALEYCIEDVSRNSYKMILVQGDELFELEWQ